MLLGLQKKKKLFKLPVFYFTIILELYKELKNIYCNNCNSLHYHSNAIKNGIFAMLHDALSGEVKKIK